MTTQTESVSQEPAGEPTEGDTPSTGEPSQELSQTELIMNAQEAYDSAQEAVQSGDWAAYGEYMDELEEILGQLAS